MRHWQNCRSRSRNRHDINLKEIFGEGDFDPTSKRIWSGGWGSHPKENSSPLIKRTFTRWERERERERVDSSVSYISSLCIREQDSSKQRVRKWLVAWPHHRPMCPQGKKAVCSHGQPRRMATNRHKTKEGGWSDVGGERIKTEWWLCCCQVKRMLLLLPCHDKKATFPGT